MIGPGDFKPTHIPRVNLLELGKMAPARVAQVGRPIPVTGRHNQAAKH
jgi:hypothetical protein